MSYIFDNMTPDEHECSCPLTQEASNRQTRIISDALADAPVLHRLVSRTRLHAQEHARPDICEQCYAWVEYFYGLSGRDVPERYRKTIR